MLYLHNTPELVHTDNNGSEYVDIIFKDARGKLYKDGKVTVLAGSKLEDLKPSAPITIFKLRSSYTNQIQDNILKIDITFKSASAAACLVYGTNANGFLKWKNKYNKYIDMYRVEFEKPMIIRQDSKENTMQKKVNSYAKKIVLSTSGLREKLTEYMYITNCYGVPTNEFEIELFINSFYNFLGNGTFNVNSIPDIDSIWDIIYEDAVAKYAKVKVVYGKLFYKQIYRDTLGTNSKVAPLGVRDSDIEIYKSQLRNYIVNFGLDEQSIEELAEYSSYLNRFTSQNEDSIVNISIEEQIRQTYTYGEIKIVLMPSYDIRVFNLGTSDLGSYIKERNLNIKDFIKESYYIDFNDNVLPLSNLLKEKKK